MITSTNTQVDGARTAKAHKTLLGHVPLSSPFYAFHPVTRLVLFVFLGVIPIFIFVPEINIFLLFVNIVLLIIGRVDLRSLRVYMPIIFTVAIFMFIVVIGTFEWASFRLLGRIPTADTFVGILVAIVTVVTDLAIAVIVGVIVSALVLISNVQVR